MPRQLTNGRYQVHAQGAPNQYAILDGKDWVASVQLNGAMTVQQQETLIKKMAAVDKITEALIAAREMFFTLGDRETQESKDCFALWEQCDEALEEALQCSIQ